MILKHNSPLKILGPRAAWLVTSLHGENKPVFRLEDVHRILGLEEPSQEDQLMDRLSPMTAILYSASAFLQSSVINIGSIASSLQSFRRFR